MAPSTMPRSRDRYTSDIGIATAEEPKDSSISTAIPETARSFNPLKEPMLSILLFLTASICISVGANISGTVSLLNSSR